MDSFCSRESNGLRALHSMADCFEPRTFSNRISELGTRTHMDQCSRNFVRLHLQIHSIHQHSVLWTSVSPGSGRGCGNGSGTCTFLDWVAPRVFLTCEVGRCH